MAKTFTLLASVEIKYSLLSEAITHSPHGKAVLAKLPVVGELAK